MAALLRFQKQNRNWVAIGLPVRPIGRQVRESLARISSRFVKKCTFGSPRGVSGGKISLPVDCYARLHAAIVFDSFFERVNVRGVARTQMMGRVTD